MTGQRGAEVVVRTPNLLTLWCIMRDQTQELVLCSDLTNPEHISVFDDIYHGSANSSFLLLKTQSFGLNKKEEEISREFLFLV